MTLVVARKINDALAIVCDTKITNELVLFPSLLDGALKTIVVSTSLCVSFAGSVDIANKALEHIIAGSVHGRDNVIAHLLKCQRQNRSACDFLVACHEPPVTLDKIIDGRCESDLPVAWIGDHDAFESFQKHRYANPFSQLVEQHSAMDEMSIASHMGDALTAVIADESVPTVDHFPITVRSGTSANPGFRYNAHAFGAGFHPVENTTEPTSILRTVGVAGGSFHYSILTPIERGIGAIAVHIVEPRLGILLYPKIRWEPMIWRNVSTIGLINLVAEEFGLTVDGIRYS